MPIDPTTAAITTYLQLGVVGATFVLLLTGILTLGRETKREREIGDKVLENNGKYADAIDRISDAVLRDRPGSGG